VIQSVGAAISQSVFDAPEVDVFSVAFDVPAPVEPVSDFFEGDPEPSASDDAAASLFEPSFEASSAPLPLFDAPEAALDRRSFLAQPDPL
jgi:hypothetical protein